MADIQCYWSLETFDCAVEKIDKPNLASQIMYCFTGKGGKFVGFHCKNSEVREFTDKLKNQEINDRKNEINKLKKEILGLENMKYPVVL